MSDGSVEDAPSQDKSETPSDNEHRGKSIPRENYSPRNTDDGELERHRSSSERSDAEDTNPEIITLPDGTAIERTQIQSMVAAHSGPLPAVQDFSGYEDVLPGAANRIMEMAETSIDAHHQTALADAELQKSVARSIDNRGLIERRQQIVFSAVTILALIGTFVMAWYDKPVPSVIALIVAAAGGYATFKTNRDGFKLYPTPEQIENSE